MKMGGWFGSLVTLAERVVASCFCLLLDFVLEDFRKLALPISLKSDPFGA